MMVNSVDVDNNIVGTNSSMTNEFQMSVPNLKWLKTIIETKERSQNKYQINKKDLNNIQKKLLKYLPNKKIIKNLIYLVDEDKFKNKRHRYLMPRNEIEFTMKELHCKEAAGHLGTDKTTEKIKSRFFWVNLSRDVKRFIRECFDCQKVKPPKVFFKPKLMASSRTLMLVTMDMAGTLPLTKRRYKYIFTICDHFTKHIKVFPMKTQTALEVAKRCLEYCLTFGIPKSVLTDQGSNFTSQVIKSLWER